MTETPKPSRPLPSPDDPLVAEFWAHCNRGALCFQRCTDCGTWRHLPRFACAQCNSDQWAWERSSGHGRIHSWTITHQALMRNFPEPLPYAVLVVELDEGVRMVAGLRGLDPAQLELDLPVEVVFEDIDGVAKLPFFRPAAI